MCVDLHTHSLYSDGSLKPGELVAMAVANKLQCLALTDHDTVEGVAELLNAAREAGLKALSGVEISATLRDLSVHILGYGFDPCQKYLHEKLQPIQEGRIRRNQAILAKLSGLGIEISPEELRQAAGNGLCGRPHFAKILVARGIVPNLEAAFCRYLGRGKPAWAPRFSYTTKEAITMIHAAGGKAVLAHPGVLTQNPAELAALVREMASQGLDGVEVYYPTHNRRLQRSLHNLTSGLKLFVTGGSDFHGALRPEHPMAGGRAGKKNFCPPCTLLAQLTAALDGAPGQVLLF